ncbi:FHA domain-containing protein [Streptomyces sp. CB03238]|uniref:FHA domain-containing protein n=1 Tax=Streptomyces sp. CB03238 TaxID=1907777 RepID=UPI000A11FBEA|nr:FHA domain-containing protein [Streptomyces sp. CB03238]ORT61488.1 cell division protein FtsK [Streptomyces sp. CB03238]
MQIRLTVLAAPPGGQTAGRACDVLVTAPAGTALAAVASGLASAVSGADPSGAVVLYAGGERLDAQRRVLGEPPLVDGAVLSLQVPGEDHAPMDGVPARLHVVAGPDAGGVHLLHAGQIRIGRSADADVPLDDPDVSRLHCAVTVTESGRVTVADLGSTNGTTLDGAEVGPRPVRLAPGALLRLGESSLRLTAGPPASDGTPLPTTPDGEGHLRVARAAGSGGGVPVPHAPGDAGPSGPGAGGAPGPGRPGSGSPSAGSSEPGHPDGGARTGGRAGSGAGRAGDPARRGGGAYAASAAASGAEGTVPARGRAGGTQAGLGGVPHQGGAGTPQPTPPRGTRTDTTPVGGTPVGGTPAGGTPMGGTPVGGTTEGGTPVSGTPTGGAPVGSSATGGLPVGGARMYGTPTGGTAMDGAPIGSAPLGGTPSGGAPTSNAPTGAPQGAPSDGAPTSGTPAGGSPTGNAPTRGTLTDGAPTGNAPAGGSRADGTVPQGAPAGGRSAAPGRRRGIGAWARRLAGGRGDGPAEAPEGPLPATLAGGAVQETWPDPAAVLLTALGPGPRLWERGPGHPETLAVRLGTTDRADLAGVPVTVGLREAGSLGLAGPRARLLGLTRSVVAQLAALHAPTDLEIVLISSARRAREWSWLGWLPHVRPAHGQDCRLLLAYDREQAAARTGELTRRLDDGPLGPGWPSADRKAVARAAEEHGAAYGTYTVVIVDGDPGSAALRETTARLAGAGAAAGIHLVCLAETPAASPLSPVAATYETACSASLAFRECGAAALLSGDVATALRLMRTAGGQPAGHGTVGTVDAVSAAWAERFARALAPLRADRDKGAEARGALGTAPRATAVPLPPSSRLLDELGLARATPASLMARWASAPDGTAVLGTGPRGPLAVDLTTEGPHLLIEGPTGSGRTELLRSVAASLAAASRPDRLGLLLVDGAGGERGEGLAPCTELPHATEHLVASDPVRMREFAQALGAELKRRAELLGRQEFTEWHTQREVADRMVGQRPPTPGDLDAPPSGTLRLRPTARTGKDDIPPPLPRLVVLVDDYDALVAPALGSPGRPAAGSVVRALEAVARDGHRLGVHLVATSARPDRTADTELARAARLRVVLDAPPASPGPDVPAPGRGRLGHPDGRVTPFQGGRVTGRIPRTATQRPTVVPLEWERMGDPPTRRPVRELGNGPTDLALLASALDRAARSVEATPLPPLVPTHPA